MRRQKTSVGRIDFVRRLMVEANLTFDQACRAYSSFISEISAGVVSGQKIGLGRVGMLQPKTSPARDVVMGFERQGRRLTKTKKVYHIPEHVVYRFRPYRKFSKTNNLKGI